MKKRNFTLVELLVVIGILAILASLIIPAVIGAKQQGRITQARADMSSLRTAFESMAKDYSGRMAKKDSGKYKLGNVSFDPSDSDSIITIGKFSSGEYDDDYRETYCKVIAELTDPANANLTVSLNKRKIKYLDPRPEYNPKNSPTDTDNKTNTWLDPWGNPYMIRINVDSSETIVDPSDTSKKLSGRIILWSLGPDGKGSFGTGNDDNAVNKDNIPGWKDGNWFD